MQGVVAEEKYIVLKIEDVKNHLNFLDKRKLSELLEKIRAGRADEGKSDNRYWVCNKDEPYSGRVIDAILCGEMAKLALQVTEGEKKQQVVEVTKNPCPCGTQRCYPEFCEPYQRYKKSHPREG